MKSAIAHIEMLAVCHTKIPPCPKKDLQISISQHMFDKDAMFDGLFSALPLQRDKRPERRHRGGLLVAHCAPHINCEEW
jgi:hypothetical protein